MSKQFKSLMKVRLVIYVAVALIALAMNLAFHGGLNYWPLFAGTLLVVFVITGVHAYIDDRQKQREEPCTATSWPYTLDDSACVLKGKHDAHKDVRGFTWSWRKEA